MQPASTFRSIIKHANMQAFIRSMGIIDRHEADPQKRWRENVEQWVNDVGDQDPFPGARKQLILKYVGPAGANKSYMWLKVPAQVIDVWAERFLSVPPRSAADEP